MSNKPTTIEEVELWKVRAASAERRALSAEIANAQKNLESINKDFEDFVKGLQEKYPGAQIREDGTLIWPEEPQAEASVSELKEEEKEEE